MKATVKWQHTTQNYCNSQLLELLSSFFFLLQIKWKYFGVSGFPAYCYFSEFLFASVIEYAQDRTQLGHEDKPHLLE